MSAVRTVLRELTPPVVLRLARSARRRFSSVQSPLQIEIAPQIESLPRGLPSLSHFLLTRYNVGLYSGGLFSNLIKDEDAWMQDRLPLFYWTVGSVRQQRTQSFTWLVVLDPETPERFRDEIAGLLPVNAEIAYARDVHLADLSQGDGTPFEWPDVEILVTSRVDNDDLLLPGYISAIQSSVEPAPCVIDSLGWVYDVDGGAARVPNFDGTAGSMFVTLVETERPFKTVMAFTHYGIVEVFPTKLIRQRLWGIRVHRTNLSNNRNV